MKLKGNELSINAQRFHIFMIVIGPDNNEGTQISAIYI